MKRCVAVRGSSPVAVRMTHSAAKPPSTAAIAAGNGKTRSNTASDWPDPPDTTAPVFSSTRGPTAVIRSGRAATAM